MPACIYPRYSFFSLYPLIVPPAVLLWIWYFLILTRLRALLYNSISLILSNLVPAAPLLPLSFSLSHCQPHLSLCLSLSLFSLLPLSLFPSLCQSNIHFFRFYFSLLPLELFLVFFLTSLLHLVSVTHSPLSFSRRLFPLCLLPRSSL